MNQRKKSNTIRSMNKALGVSLLMLLLLVFWSCGDGSLSRSKAEQLLKAAHYLPSDEIKSIEVTDRSIYAHSTFVDFKKLEKEGLLTWTEKRRPNGNWDRLYGQLTEKGKQYAVSEPYAEGANRDKQNVKVAELKFGEITGIMERKGFNVAEVSYTIVRTNVTPFGRILFNLKEETERHSCIFSKYDDGWRIGRNQ